MSVNNNKNRCGFLVGSVVKKLPANAGDKGLIPGLERPLEKEMETHSRILAWEIPWTEEPGEIYSPWGCRVRHDLVTKQQWRNTTHPLYHIQCKWREKLASVPPLAWVPRREHALATWDARSLRLGFTAPAFLPTPLVCTVCGLTSSSISQVAQR